jgi:hypothetical protein
VVLLLIGIQVKMVDSYVLNSTASSRLLPKSEKTLAAGYPFVQMATAEQRKTITPPPWAGWLLISAGAVLTLHALAMPKAGG